jgi:uroporphyrinogen decarboxylase
MNSRERVLAAINHIQPDKIPIDLGSNPSSGISAIAYDNLKKHLGMNHPTLVYDVVQQLAQPDQEIIDHFGLDIIDIGRAFNTGENDWYEYTLANGGSAFYPVWYKPQKAADGSWFTTDENNLMLSRMPNGATFFDQTFFPYFDEFPKDYAKLPEAMQKVMWVRHAHSPWDHAGEENFWQQLREKALFLKENTDKALFLSAGSNLFEFGTMLRRMDNFFMDLLMNQDEVARLVDVMMEMHLATLEKVCNAVGDIVDVVRFGDDLGMTTGPFMDIETYRLLFKPHHKRLCDFVKKNSNMKIMLHSCGSIYQYIPDLIECGYDILNPVQTNCLDMEPQKLKNEFGNEITFWGGGIDTASVLNNATPEAVRKHVLNRCEIFSKGGGFVFNTVHNIMPDVPPENIIAMFSAVKEFNGEDLIPK